MGLRIFQPKINTELLEQRGCSYTDSEDIKALHMALEVLKSYHRMNGPWNAKDQEHMIQVVTRLEYLLQDLWGFDRSMEKHTHVYAFDLDAKGEQA